MRNEAKAFLIILIALGLDRFCTIVSPSIYVDPFIFYDMRFECDGVVYEGVNLQYVVKAVSVHLLVIMFMWSFRIVVPSMNKALKFSQIVEWCGLADFFLIYEQAIFGPVEFTDIRILLHGVIFLLWRIGKL